MIDEMDIEQDTEVGVYEYIISGEPDIDILEPTMIGFGICGVMCMISLGISVIISILRRGM